MLNIERAIIIIKKKKNRKIVKGITKAPT